MKKLVFSTFLILLILTMLSTILIGVQAEDSKKAVLLTVQRLGDEGPVDLCYEGLLKGGKEFGYETKVVEVREGEYEDATRTMAELDYDIIFCTFPNMIDAVKAVAPDFPDLKFVLLIGDVEDPSLTNVKCMNGKEHESCFPVGILAGLMTKTDHIGFLGGVDNPQINRFLAGYEQGAKLVNPDVIIEASWAGSFEDPVKGKELTIIQLGRGADVIFHGSARTGFGMFDAIDEVGVMAIGVDTDQCGVSKNVIGSMRIFFERWVYETMKEISEGKFQSGTYWYGLASGMVGYVICKGEDRAHPVPQSVEDAILKAMEDVRSGKITIDPISERLK